MKSSKEILKLYKNLLEISIKEFKNLVESGEILYSQSNEPWKLRIFLCDGSFIDIHYSINNNYSYHWDRQLVDKKIYRHDNAPHSRWRTIKSFPKHFHNGSEDNVVESDISDDPEIALKEFLNFVEKEIKRGDQKVK